MDRLAIEQLEWRGVPSAGRMIRMTEVFSVLGVSSSTYYDKAKSGEYPKPVKIGARAAGLPESWVAAIVGGPISVASISLNEARRRATVAIDKVFPVEHGSTRRRLIAALEKEFER